MNRRAILWVTIVIVLAFLGLRMLIYYGIVPDVQLRTPTQAEVGLASVFVALLATLAAWQTVREMRLAREVEERPYILIDFDFSNRPLIDLVVTNIGNGSARDVKFHFQPDMITSDGRNISELRLFKDGLQFFPPGKMISQFFDTSIAYFRDEHSTTYEVAISYYNATRTKHYQDPPISLDLSAYRGISYLERKDMNDLVKEIKEVRKSLTDTYREIKRGVAKLDKGIPINTYEVHVISQVDKQTILSKLMEFRDVWTHFYLESTEPYRRLGDIQGKLLSLGREIANLTPACRELDRESVSEILKIASRINDLAMFQFYADGGESVKRFDSQGEEILTLIEAARAKLREPLGGEDL